MSTYEIIKNTLSINNIEANELQLNQLSRYYELVVEYNKNINLTAITEPNDFACKHFADSLLNYKYYKENSTVCDIGTGAGFPGIPLKILRPDLKVILVDSLQKRINFLNIVIKELNLSNISTIHSRAQELTQNGVERESCDYVVSRAVAQLNILSEFCLPFVTINGEMIAYKSTNTKNEIQLSKNALTVSQEFNKEKWEKAWIDILKRFI